MDELEPIVERIREEFAQKNAVRDLTLTRARSLIRHCANSIRATHRHEYASAQDLLDKAREAAEIMCQDASAYADIYHAGYVQDALKELAEATITLALVTGDPLPDPDALDIPYAPYLNGLGEAMGEMRRFALESIRQDDTGQAEILLGVMEEVYGQLVTIDFPSALTRGLRHTTDMVRGVTERTRGDLTTAVRQEKLQNALRHLEEKLGE